MTQEIADSPIPKVELPVAYALGWRNSQNSHTLSTNTPIEWNQFKTNSDLIIKPSGSGNFNQITLKEGYIYKLTGYLSVHEQSGSITAGFQWYNVTESKWEGSAGGFYTGRGDYHNGGTGPAIAYINIEKDTVFQLRVSQGSSLDGETWGTSFEVQHFQNLQI